MKSSNRDPGQRAAALAAGLAGALALGAACSEDSPPVRILNLDRPNVVAFGCFGDYRVNGGDPEAEGSVVRSAQPIESCVAHAAEDPPLGQGDLVNAPRLYGFLLQDSRGTVAVIDVETQSVLDSDPLTPGKNAIPIGTLPVGLAADQSGCFMVSTSAASCDLSALDVTSALDLEAAAGIAQISITNSDGVRMRAKARTLIGGPQTDVIGQECPATPTGTVYLAYPACHLVAAVDAATGVIQGGLQFDEDGNGVPVAGSVTCPDECGDGSVTGTLALGGPDAGPDGGVPPDAGPPSVDGGLLRPVALHRGEDGRVYVGSENSPKITVIDLDEVGLPVGSRSIQLEGEVGVVALALSPVMTNAGDTGSPGGGGGQSRFLYVVATDRTVRVVKVELDDEEGPGALRECETQADPRYLVDDPSTPADERFTDLVPLSCLPIGDPLLPRRYGALSPGIQLPGDQIPLDVAFQEVRPPPPEEGEETNEAPSPLNLSGTFAYVTTSQGNVYVVNVDDDVYPDVEDVNDPAAVAITLALPHQIRDNGAERDAVATSCGAPSTDPTLLGPRVDISPNVIFSAESIALEKLGLMPSVRQIRCESETDVVAASQLSFLAPAGDREIGFPDWRAVRNETWSVAWEGVLSRDGFTSSVDGLAVRSGAVSVDGYHVRVDDPSGSFCQLGAEQLDEVRLLGCDPAFGNGQCGVGETCYIHPDTPAEVTTGVCLPADQAESLAMLCRDFLVSHRRYSAVEVKAGSVELIPRRRVLRTSPLDGCTSDPQCEEMAQVEQTLSDPAHPIQLGELPATGFDWVCTQDPSRPAAPDRCLMACETSDDCEAGDACLAGYCNQGAPPWPECVQAVQRFQVRASDAFVVIGSTTGYLHNWEKGADDACVLKENPDPLAVGRIPLRPVECEGAGPTALSPNPCVTTVSDTRLVTPYDGENQCVADTPEIQTAEEVRAIRFQNPSLRFDLVNTELQGDEQCIGDGAAGLPPFSPLHAGFEIDISLVGGFIPLFVQFALIPTFPVRIQPGPDGRLWVIDQGDGAGAAGRVYTFVPSATESLFLPGIID